MKKLTLVNILLLIGAITINAKQSNFSKLDSPYLGQKPPGIVPEIFAPGIVSTEAHEFSCCFSPDGNEFYFARRHPALNQIVVMYTKLVNDNWTEPAVAPFVNNQYSFEPSVTPDNKRIYFQSGVNMQMNVLYVDRNDSGWGSAVKPGSPFNPSKAMHISSTNDGTIYTTDISGGPGTECLAIIRKEDGVYKTLEKLGPPLNNEKLSQHPWISPDESYMFFCVRRPNQAINSALFYTYRKNDSTWEEPKEIELDINAGQPFVTIDGKYLFFTSGPQNLGNIYWVSTDIVFTDIRESTSEFPDEFKLHQNYPNPFNPSTIVNYDLPENRWVTLKVYNVLGNEVMTLVDEFQHAGNKSVKFDGSDLPSGIYFYRVVIGKYVYVRKMVIAG